MCMAPTVLNVAVSLSVVYLSAGSEEQQLFSVVEDGGHAWSFALVMRHGRRRGVESHYCVTRD